LNDSGVVEKNIDLAIACQNLRHGGLNLRTFKQIALDGEDFAAAGRQLCFGALKLIGVPRQNRHFPAFARDLARQIRPSPREPPLIRTTFPVNEKLVRHAREASHAPRIAIAIAGPRLINTNSYLAASADDKLCRSPATTRPAPPLPAGTTRMKLFSYFMIVQGPLSFFTRRPGETDSDGLQLQSHGNVWPVRDARYLSCNECTSQTEAFRSKVREPKCSGRDAERLSQQIRIRS
jgi:hypothetical protein